MKQTSPITRLQLLRNTGIFFLLFAVAQYGFAVDGRLNNGGRNSSRSFSHLKTDLNLSLRNDFTYHNNRSFGFNKVDQVETFNSVMTFQRGNVTIAMPFKHKMAIQKFRTPSAPLIR